jgi:DNA-binding CsgD family transcriptional regulator
MSTVRVAVPGAWREERMRQRDLYPGQKEALTRRYEGETTSETAYEMGISKQTVVSYLVGAKHYLGVATIDEAVHEAHKLGEIPFYR